MQRLPADLACLASHVWLRIVGQRVLRSLGTFNSVYTTSNCRYIASAMNDSGVDSKPSSGPSAGKVNVSIQIDAELLEQISHLTSDPSKVIEVAVRQWLGGGNRRDDDLTRTLRRNPPVPPKGEWND